MFHTLDSVQNFGNGSCRDKIFIRRHTNEYGSCCRKDLSRSCDLQCFSEWGELFIRPPEAIFLNLQFTRSQERRVCFYTISAASSSNIALFPSISSFSGWHSSSEFFSQAMKVSTTIPAYTEHYESKWKIGSREFWQMTTLAQFFRVYESFFFRFLLCSRYSKVIEKAKRRLGQHRNFAQKLHLTLFS